MSPITGACFNSPGPRAPHGDETYRAMGAASPCDPRPARGAIILTSASRRGH